MRNRFYSPMLTDPIELTGEEFHHAVRVARCREGEEVECFDGSGRNVVARFTAISPGGATLTITGEAPSREPRIEIVLAMSLVQPEKFELVLQKGTELGVAKFLPLVAERTEVRPERIAGKIERWKKIVLEAAKQSGRSRIPLIEQVCPFDEAIRRPGARLLFDLDEPPHAPEPPEEKSMILIGPEGGFSPGELAAARAAGVLFRRIGPRRLRAETAAIAAITLTTNDLVAG
jgi:16S rRNA (uracil1498-N3)-methyltransferase